MKSRRKLYFVVFQLLAVVIFFTGTLHAQSVANYAVTRTTGNSYNSVSISGNAVPSWRNNGSFSQDDNRSNFIDIGFDFWYDGTRYTQLCVSTNGFIDFSSSTDDGGPQADNFGYYNPAFTTSNINNATRPAIAPFYDDMTAQGGTDPLGNSIRYSTTGTAPYRVFTIEWINMAVYLNTSPSLNFQVKLYESTGVIEMNYGTMNNGTQTFSYTCGINAPTMNNSPTAAQLKTQQSANSATFSNSVQNNLSSMPASGSRLKFTPPVPANPAGTLSFSAVQQTAMTLNWSNWANNEVGYVVYYSYDGINYFFAGQTAANATSYTVTGLSPGTAYHFTVQAVTEGALSNALTGTHTTNAAGNKVSAQTGNWNNSNSWSPAGVPTASDNVTILNGHTITLNTTGNCNDLTIGQGSGGTLKIGNNGSARTLNVNGNILVNNNATFQVNTSSNTTHNLNINGSIVNNGNFDLYPDANSRCNATFASDVTQSVTGSGSNTNFYLITLNIGTGNTDRLDVSASNLGFPSNFLTLTSGTFHLNSSQTSTYAVNTGTFTITSGTGIWLEGNSTLTFGNTLQLDGLLQITGGLVQVGNAANENLNANGGTLLIDGGALEIAGHYYNTNVNTISNFTISGGSLTVPTIGSTSTTESPFTITSPGAVFNMSGGSIIIQREGGTGNTNLGYQVNNVSFSSVTGGVLQIGNTNTPVSSVMKINTTVPVGNLLVTNSATGQLDVNNLIVTEDININNNGILNANNLNITLGGNWNDQSSFVCGTGTVNFNTTGSSTLTHASAETFNNLIIGGTADVTLISPITVNGNLTINSQLDAGTNNSTVSLKKNWVNNGVFIPRAGIVNFTGTSMQTMSGTGTSSFYDLNIQNTAGVKISSGDYAISDALYLNSGLFDVNAAGSITLQSSASGTARIAPVVSGTLSGNFIVERYIDSRAAGYSDFASPVGATTFQDWANELPNMVYAYNPPNAYPSAWGYSESLWDYVPVTSSGTSIAPGQGFEIWLDTYANYSTFNAQKMNSVGQPTIGNVNVSSAITNVNDGWNLTGNPYASFISLDNLIASSNGISNTIMIYDETINDYQSYSTGSGIEIAPHQGFWVQATSASPSLIFSESHKTTSVNSTFRTLEADFSLRLEVTQSQLPFTSNTVFKFSAAASDEWDEYDLTFLGIPHPEAPQLFSKAGTHNLRVNSLNSATNNQVIDLNYSVANSGTCRIVPVNPDVLLQQGFTCAILLDQQTGVRTDLFSADYYEFEASVGDPASRFVLLLSKTNDCSQLVSDETLVNFIPVNDGINIQLSLSATQNAGVQVINALGQEIAIAQSMSPGSLLHISQPVTTGIYHIIVTVDGKSYNKKFFAN